MSTQIPNIQDDGMDVTTRGRSVRRARASIIDRSNRLKSLSIAGVNRQMCTHFGRFYSVVDAVEKRPVQQAFQLYNSHRDSWLRYIAMSITRK
ncbi:hypothetical protein BSL82_10540 [Tardibacter chloracetimidivorans]|uniref:Uncharacterized protein n=1 Tax=Tardibacter chloracetimidivorans TaxID=1921510 RepID=A0A1L3ZVP8_9SPHN|nr:hypothetical protein BSL82_10540 [Tardibacter chloracetimidivorans]